MTSRRCHCIVSHYDETARAHTHTRYTRYTQRHRHTQKNYCLICSLQLVDIAEIIRHRPAGSMNAKTVSSMMAITHAMPIKMHLCIVDL